jgi:hypothetical protein
MHISDSMKKLELPKAIICDLDGTLALLGDRSPFDASTAEDDLINLPIANILEVYDNQSLYDISLILLSGREEHFRGATERWLKKYKITNYKALYLRKNRDFRKDFVVKKEIYEKRIKRKYDVLFVLEDRDQVVKMWREVGLPCLQVAYGDF